MGRGQTNRHTHKRTSRLLERIGLRADSLKNKCWSFFGIGATMRIGQEIQRLQYVGFKKYIFLDLEWEKIFYK